MTASRQRAGMTVVAIVAAVTLLLSLCGVGVAAGIRLRQARAQPTAVADAFVCGQPLLTVIALATPAPGQPTPTAPPGAFGPPLDSTPGTEAAPLRDSVATAPPGRPIQSLAFLDLPFPYDGGNQNFGGTAAQFRQASQRTGQGGRINSFFDHFYPLYPAPEDPTIKFGREPADPPIGKHILTFHGLLGAADYYSGHPAYDYAPFVRREPTTPLFAAADGVIHSVGEHSSGALYVRLVHHVPGVGAFQTIYWHLHPDEHFDAMLGRSGQSITAGTRIGTMGNTGWSTGHHLHFEVRFDRNNDGGYSADEAVDPYGFIPSGEYPVDPWGQAASFIDGQGELYNHYPSHSDYLWIHPIGASAPVPADGGGQLNPDADVGGEGGTGTLCAEPGSLPEGGVVNWSWTPDPLPGAGLAGVGQSCVVSAFDRQGNAVLRFNPPLAIVLPYDDAELARSGIDAASLAIHLWPSGAAEWQALPTRLDTDRKLALAYVDQPGHCALLGATARDLTAPRTTIWVSGPAASDGALYDDVIVHLDADDPSGVERIDYSLDAGATWQAYTGPFGVMSSGLPESPDPNHTGEGIGAGPGRYLVLASAVDGAGNVESPPAVLRFSIDPSKGPTPTASASPTATDAATATPTGTPTATSTPTPTPSRTATLLPLWTATPTPRPPIVFTADRTTLTPGMCTTLRWQVDGVRAVHLYGAEFGPAPGQGVAGQGTRQVCDSSLTFSESTRIYTLRVTLLDDTVVERTVRVSVVPPAAATQTAAAAQIGTATPAP